MSDQDDWDFAGPDDAKAEIRAAVCYLLEVRRLGRERDPAHWREKYFELLALNVRRRQEREMLQAIGGGTLPLLKWLLHW
jgi:hypothetical protein